MDKHNVHTTPKQATDETNVLIRHKCLCVRVGELTSWAEGSEWSEEELALGLTYLALNYLQSQNDSEKLNEVFEHLRCVQGKT